MTETNRKQVALGWKDGKPVRARTVEDQTAGTVFLSDKVKKGEVDWGGIYSCHTVIARPENG